jgi:hypothetical protein
MTDETDNDLRGMTTALSAKVNALRVQQLNRLIAEVENNPILAGAITPSFKARMEAISVKLSNPDLYEATGSGWKVIAKEIVMLTLAVKAALDRKLAEARQLEGNRQ